MTIRTSNSVSAWCSSCHSTASLCVSDVVLFESSVSGFPPDGQDQPEEESRLSTSCFCGIPREQHTTEGLSCSDVTRMTRMDLSLQMHQRPKTVYSVETSFCIHTIHESPPVHCLYCIVKLKGK